MASRFKSPLQFWLWMGVSILVFPLIFVSMNMKDIEQLESLGADRGSRFEAVMTRLKKNLIFDTVIEGQIVCAQSRCDYAESDLDIGRPRRFVMADGWLLAVERDGGVVDVRGLTIARKHRTIRFYSFFAALSIPCLFMAYFKRHRPSLN